MRPGARRLSMLLLALSLTHCGVSSEDREQPSSDRVMEVDEALAAADCVPATRLLEITRIRGPEGMVAVGDQLFFIVAGFTDWSLWKSDGTTSGTVRVKVIAPITAPEGPRALTEARGLLFFSSNGVLWRSDGTASGTHPVDVPRLTNAHHLREYRGRLLVIRPVPGSGDELWLTDGTVAGSRRILGTPPALAIDRFPSRSVETERGDLVFVAERVGDPGRPRVFRLTRSGALVELFQASRGGIGITQLTAVGDKVFFFTDELAPGEPSHLWSSDGAPGSAVLLRNFGLFGPPFGLTAFDGRLFFTAGAEDGPRGFEPWVSDGTPAGTHPFVDIRPGESAGSLPTNMTVLGDRLYFVADDGVHGRELWVTDGTAAGTRLFIDLQPGAPSSFPYGLATANGKLYFVADDGVHGSEPWKVFEGRPRRVADIIPGGGSAPIEPGVGLFDAPAGSFVRAGSFVYFLTATGETPDNALWSMKTGSYCPPR
ncbi:MAG TPA: ELWxxDGT repeat protein [Archangium sp.]|uniref:ELWxxDGT repeat protein n=1 Tax=Archangium sp. TaxID=1872627 RepID=UPI002E35D41C|nr:ELWxxDGT repeat protein [Archangium sp.]HEX5753916.1 ELWxxDGT repeat protein [Archangium sp.]